MCLNKRANLAGPRHVGLGGMLAVELATCTPAYWPTPPDQRTIRCGARRSVAQRLSRDHLTTAFRKVFPARIKHFGVKKLKSCNFVCRGKARLESLVSPTDTQGTSSNYDRGLEGNVVVEHEISWQQCQWGVCESRCTCPSSRGPFSR